LVPEAGKLGEAVKAVAGRMKKLTRFMGGLFKGKLNWCNRVVLQ